MEVKGIIQINGGEGASDIIQINGREEASIKINRS